MKKQLISLLLCLAVALSLIPIGTAFASETADDVKISFRDCTLMGNAQMAGDCINWITTVGSGFSFVYNNTTDDYLQAEIGCTYSAYKGGDSISILSEEIASYTTVGTGDWANYQAFDSIGHVLLKPGTNTITFRSDKINGSANIGYNVTEIRLSNFQSLSEGSFNRKALFGLDDFTLFGRAVFEGNAPYTNVGYMIKDPDAPEEETGLSFTCTNRSDKPVYATVGAKLTTNCGSFVCTSYAVTANGEEPMSGSVYTPPNFGTWDINSYTIVDRIGTVLLQPGENTIKIAADTVFDHGMNVQEVYLSEFVDASGLSYDSKAVIGLSDFTLAGRAVFEPSSAPYTNVGYMVKDANAPEAETSLSFTYVNRSDAPLYATVGAKLTTNFGGNVCTSYAVTANGQEPLPGSVYTPPDFGTWDVNHYTVVDRIGAVLLQPGENTVKIEAATVSAFGMNVQEVYLTEFLDASVAMERLEASVTELNAYVNETVELPEDLTVTAYYADGTSATVEDYRLSSGSPDLFTLSGQTLAGTKEGTAELMVTYGPAALMIPVHVVDRTPTIKLDKANFMTNSGKTVNIGAKTAYVTEPIVWTSDNAAVATVDENGNVTGHSHGDAIITATAGSAVATCRVSVDYEGQNPYLPPSWGLYICDPEPYVIDGRMYVFGSTDRPMAVESDGSSNFCAKEYHVIYTDDMINWTDVGVTLTLEDIPQEYRGGNRLWGPSSLFKAREEGSDRDKYYFIANTNSYTSGMVLFEADSPTGPFVNPRPMTMDGKVIGNLDPGVLVDDDGKVYFAYQYDGYKFAVCQLDPADFSNLLSDTVVDVTDVFKEGNPNEWPDEGQSLKKRGDTYYYLNMLNYAPNNTGRIPVKMAYLMADSPLGPWRYGGKIIDTFHYLDSSNIQGGFAEFNGQWYVTYHMPTPDASSSRYSWIDPITFNEDGTIRQIEPTSSGAKGSFRPGEKIQSSSGVHYSGGRGDKRIVQRYEGNLSQWWTDSFRFTDYPETWYSAKGQFIGYRYMNFNTAIRQFEITARTSGENAVLKIYKGAEKGSANDAPGDGVNQPAKDGPTGELIATVALPNTGNQYETFTVPATVTEAGIYSFYIVLDTAPTGGNVYVDSMRFVEDPQHVHTYDQENTDVRFLKTEATCTAAAVYYKSCECRLISDTETFSYGTPLEHDYSTDWSTDETNHWHECLHCDAKKDERAHSFEWVVDKEPTENEEGLKYEECLVCKAKGSEESFGNADVAAPVDALIAAIDVEDKATIEAARAAYDALTDAQKALVTKLAELEAAELYWNTVNMDVSLLLTGADEIHAFDESVTYTLSGKDMHNLATMHLTFDITDEYLAEPVAKAADGWYIVVQTWAEGKLDLVICNNDGANGEGEILTITAKPTQIVGEATVSITFAELGAYLGESETFVTANLTAAAVTTTVKHNIFDVNKDGMVDLRDVTRAQRWYGTDNADADVNKDGTVNIDDLVLILNNFTDLFQ